MWTGPLHDAGDKLLTRLLLQLLPDWFLYNLGLTCSTDPVTLAAGQVTAAVRCELA
jgi:hypothetical protein